MKTTVQQIIEKFEHIQEKDCKTLTEVIFLSGVLAILETVYLETEKQQIIDAYIQGYCHCEYEGVMDTENYYNSTYK